MLDPARIERFPDRAAWLQARTRGRRLGASDAPAILNGDEWSVYARLMGQAPPVDAATQALFDRGHEQEPIALWRYARRTGHRVYATGQAFPPVEPSVEPFSAGPVIIRHPSLPWAAFSPDGFVNGNLLAEVKSDLSPWRWGDEQTCPAGFDWEHSPVPEEHVQQVLFQLACLNGDEDPPPFPAAILIASLGNFELRTYRIEHDGDLQGRLMDHLGDWYRRHVVDGVPPEITASPACSAYYRSRFPEGEPPRASTTEEDAYMRGVWGCLETRRMADKAISYGKNRLAACMTTDRPTTRIEGPHHRAVVTANGLRVYPRRRSE